MAEVFAAPAIFERSAWVVVGWWPNSARIFGAGVQRQAAKARRTVGQRSSEWAHADQAVGQRPGHREWDITKYGHGACSARQELPDPLLAAIFVIIVRLWDCRSPPELPVFLRNPHGEFCAPGCRAHGADGPETRAPAVGAAVPTLTAAFWVAARFFVHHVIVFFYFLVRVNFLATSGAPERLAGNESTEVFICSWARFYCNQQNPVLENVNNLLPNADSAL